MSHLNRLFETNYLKEPIQRTCRSCACGL